MARRRTRSDAPFSLFAFQDIITSVTGIVLFITLILTLELVVQETSSPVQQTTALVAEIQQALNEAQAEIESLQQSLQEKTSNNAASAGIASQDLTRIQYETDSQITRLQAEIQKMQQQSHVLSDGQRSWEAKRFDRNQDRQQLKSLQGKIAATKTEKEKLSKSNRVVFNPSGTSSQAWIVELSENRIQVAQAGIQAAPLVFDSLKEELRHSAFLRWANQQVSGQVYFVLLIQPRAIDSYYEILPKLKKSGFRVGFDLLGNGQTAIDPIDGAGYRSTAP